MNEETSIDMDRTAKKNISKKKRERISVIRVLVLLILTCAFIYQAITFLNYVFQYPTVVSIDIILPEKILAPAFTFCSNVKYSRSKFCKKLPDCCNSTDDDFCAKHKDYCETAKIRVKKECLEQLEYLEDSGDLENIEDLENKDIEDLENKDIVDLENMVMEDLEYNMSDIIDDPPIDNEDPDGRFSALRRGIPDETEEYMNCFSYGGAVESQDEIKHLTKYKWDEKWKHSNHFRLKAPDMFNPQIPPGIVFDLHPPSDAVNPFEYGHFLKPGILYNVFVEAKEVRSLPHPYKTNCINYLEQWLEKNRKGPRSKQMCQSKCLVDFNMELHNCTDPGSLYPLEDREVCSPEEFKKRSFAVGEEQRRLPGERWLKCSSACRRDCVETSYSYSISEKPLNAHSSRWHRINKSVIQLTVYFNIEQLTVYEFSPKYEKVEIFSYIGGFLGLWLGISFVEVADYISSIFADCWKFLKKKASSKEENVL